MIRGNAATFAAFVAFAALTSAAHPAGAYGADDPKVPLAFNRLYDYPELVTALEQLCKGHPDLLTMHSIGKSVEGRDLWCVTVNNPKTGPDTSKAAMYVDGNIHGNEVQAAEASLYLIWYLAENHGKLDAVTKLVDERVFYVVPTVNPDGRAWWFSAPNTPSSSRSGKSPRDDDRDGVADEDGYDDLDGDGNIAQMRRRDPKGRMKTDPNDPRRMIPAKPDEDGEFELLGMEGIDNDGDGQVNEDPPGGYDMNRNWPADWQPDYIQRGAGPFPLCWPETQAVADFVRTHPNIAGVQAFHNNGGMILRGPGHPSRQAEYPQQDDRIAMQIAAVGEKMLPFYRSMVIHKDLYEVHGGFVGWTYEHLGIFSFTNELWNGDQLLAQAAAGATPPTGDSEQTRRARERLMLGADLVEWHTVRHPTYGTVEVGGTIKESQRVPPPFLLEELCHRNAAFVMYHAEEMPRVIWHEVRIERLAPETFAVNASLRNTCMIPSRSAQASRRNLGMPDTLTLEGPSIQVLSGGRVVNQRTNEVNPVDRLPAKIPLDSGVGNDPVSVRWIVRGQGDVSIRFKSEKAIDLTRTESLK